MINKTRIKNKAKIKAKHRRSLAFMSSRQQGFTLIELLVVVSILAALAGITSVAMDGYQQDAEEKITRVEMQRIAGAIRRFKADTGYWPKTEVRDPALAYVSEDAASFSFLFNNPAGVPAWDVEYAIGWHGPYIDLPAMKAIALDSISNDGCDGATNTVITNLERFNTGIIDRFQQLRERNSGGAYCVITRDEDNPAEFTQVEYSGSPYLYNNEFFDAGNALCTVNPGCVALRSFGPDGVDNDGDDASDDIVFVLEVN